MDHRPPWRPSGASGLLLLLLLLLLIAGLVVWARDENPVPNPTSTAIPDAVPGGTKG